MTDGLLPVREEVPRAEQAVAGRVRRLTLGISISATLLATATAASGSWMSAAFTLVLSVVALGASLVVARSGERHAKAAAHATAAAAMFTIFTSGIAEVPTRSSSFFYCTLVTLCAAHMVGVRAAKLWTVIGVFVVIVGHAVEAIWHLSSLPTHEVMLHVLDSIVLTVFAGVLAAGARGLADRQIAYLEQRERMILVQAEALAIAKQGAEAATAQAILAARALERTNQALEDANHAKSRFLANMSHELRTPMNGVLGVIELLAGTPLSAEQREYVETVRSSGRTLLTVINDVLDFSKIEAGKLTIEREEVVLRRMITDVAQLFAEPARAKGLELDVSTDPDVPEAVFGDDVRLRQVLSNLLSNAVKFTERGSISLSVELVRPPSPDGAALRFECRDTGSGMTAQVLARIFRPFEQGDGSSTRRSGGTGLGLAISKQLVDLMGGALEVESEEGRGSRFWFVLEVEPFTGQRRSTEVVDALEARGAERGGGSAGAPGLRVLVVEDNPVNRMIATKFLERVGVEASVAANGAEAIEAVTTSEPFDLILMDCQMPVMDGYAATERIRALEQGIGRHTPIIALTANALEGDAELCVACGMDAHLGKPYTPQQLLEVIGHWVRRPSHARSRRQEVDSRQSTVDS